MVRSDLVSTSCPADLQTTSASHLAQLRIRDMQLVHTFGGRQPSKVYRFSFFIISAIFIKSIHCLLVSQRDGDGVLELTPSFRGSPLRPKSKVEDHRIRIVGQNSE